MTETYGIPRIRMIGGRPQAVGTDTNRLECDVRPSSLFIHVCKRCAYPIPYVSLAMILNKGPTVRNLELPDSGTRKEQGAVAKVHVLTALFVPERFLAMHPSHGG